MRYILKLQKTFEGHTNSVLQVSFLNQDLQLISTASDGLLKSWNIRTEECIGTMDNHDDKVGEPLDSNSSKCSCCAGLGSGSVL